MSAAKAKEKVHREVALTLSAQKRDGAMYLREAHAAGEVEHDGVTWKVEYAVTMNGTPMVTVSRDGVEGWTVYSLPIDKIMRAVCAAHFGEEEDADV